MRGKLHSVDWAVPHWRGERSESCFRQHHKKLAWIHLPWKRKSNCTWVRFAFNWRRRDCTKLIHYSILSLPSLSSQCSSLRRAPNAFRTRLMLSTSAWARHSTNTTTQFRRKSSNCQRSSSKRTIVVTWMNWRFASFVNLSSAKNQLRPISSRHFSALCARRRHARISRRNWQTLAMVQPCKKCRLQCSSAHWWWHWRPNPWWHLSRCSELQLDRAEEQHQKILVEEHFLWAKTKNTFLLRHNDK